MIKKFSYVLEKKQKINICILMVVILGGSLMEMLGVSAILPVVNIAIDPSCIDTTWYLTKIRDFMGFNNPQQLLIFMSGALIIIYILKNAYITMMYSMQYKFVFYNQKKLAVKMMNCYMHQDYLFHVSKNVAELRRNITEDVNGFFTVILYALQFMAEFSVGVAIAAMLFVTDFVTTMAIVVLVLIFGIFFALVYKKILTKKGEQNRELNVQTNKWIFQAFSGIKEIKVGNNEKFFIDNYNNSYSQFAVLQRQQSLLTFIPRPLMETICIGGILLVVIVKLKFDNSDITSFIPILSVFAFSLFRMLPLFNRITGYMGGIMFDLPAVDAVYHDLVEIEEIMKKKNENEDTDINIELEKSIKVENVSFRYPESENWILDNANLEIAKNNSIGLIGTSGAGKTTVVDIILGLLEPQKGKITVDGVDIRKHMKSWHQCIGYIPQTIYLMDDTIKANIAFGIPESQVDDNELRRAMKEAQLESFVETLPDGVNTFIGDRGIKLSGGQRQRIGIARALYRNPQILILDEATSALDNDTEKEVMDAIDGLHGQRTLIIIAHRLTTIKNCDAIYEVGDGIIKEKSHEEIFG